MHGKTFAKGFSTVVFPTDTLDNALLWHLYCADDGSRLPYPDFENARCVLTQHSRWLASATSWDGVPKQASALASVFLRRTDCYGWMSV